MEEGTPESTIKVAVPSYPAEFGNEAYRIAESMEASAAGDATLAPPYEAADPTGDYYPAADAQQPVQPQPHVFGWDTHAFGQCLLGWPVSKSYVSIALVCWLFKHSAVHVSSYILLTERITQKGHSL